jgi:hypothetical protein
MAGAGYKLFSTGDVLSASDVNTYLQQQTVMVFASAAARTTALASVLAEGMVTYLKDTDVVEIYTGAAWVSLDDPNAIQNSIVDAKGDIITATADNTPARLAVGTNGQTLVADSTASTGLKWATLSSTAQGVWVNNAAAISIPSATFTTITADTETYDTDAFHSTTTNTGRLTVPTGLGGKYIASFNLYCTGAAATIWYGIWQVNGTNYNRVLMKSPGGSESQTLAITQHFNLAAGDYVTIQAYQASGSTYTISIGEYGGFGMMRIGA